jgi:hypothetical protein
MDEPGAFWLALEQRVIRALTDRPSTAIANLWPQSGALLSRRRPSGRATTSFFILKKSFTFVVISCPLGSMQL